MNKEQLEEEVIEYDLKEEFKKIIKPTVSTIFLVLPLFLLTILSAIYLTENIYQQISLIGMGIFLTLSSIQDFQEKMVFEFLLYPIALFSIFFIPNDSLENYITILQSIGLNIVLGVGLVGGIWFISFILSLILKKETLGTGDFPIFFAFIIVLGFHTPIGLIIMSLTAILYKIITKEEYIPLIPFLYIGMIFTYIYVHLIMNQQYKIFLEKGII